MTKCDLYASCIPVIEEMIVRCRKLDRGVYEDWKRETVKQCPDTVKDYMGKVLTVIDKHVLKGDAKMRFENEARKVKKYE